MKIRASRFTSKAAPGIVLLLFGVLAACGGTGGKSGSGNNGGTSTAAQAAPEFLYVSDTVGAMFGFSIDANSGALSPVRAGNEMDVVGWRIPPTATSPGVLYAGTVRIAADPNGAQLYYSRAQLDGGVNLGVLFSRAAGGNVDPGELGTWSDLNDSLNIPPGKLVVDPAGKNLYVIPDPSAKLAELLSFSIAPGTPHSPHLVALTTPTTAVPGVPRDITVDPSGHYVYGTFAGKAGVQVAGYSRDQTTGALTNLPNSPFANTGGSNSQGIRITPSGSFALVANAATNNVSVMSLDATTGTLTNVAGSPFAAGANPIAVAIDATSKFAFVANQGDNTLSAYSIAAGGALSTVAGSPYSIGTKPQSVTVDPSGKFVYVATADGAVWGFALNTATGSLTPLTGSPFHPNLVNTSTQSGFCVPCGAELRDIVVLKQ